jgi:tetratricopeptide (TPR) repeat protein
MHRTVVLAAYLTLLPAAAFAVGSGMGMYGTASFGGGGGGNASADNAKEEYETATRLMDKQDYGAAVSHLIRVLRVEQGNPEVLNDLGYATRMAGDYPTSLDYLQRAISRSPELKIAHANLGQLYLAMHQPDQAHQQLDTLKQLCPGGCDEQDSLKEAVAAYEVAAKAPASAPGAAPQK